MQKITNILIALHLATSSLTAADEQLKDTLDGLISERKSIQSDLLEMTKEIIEVNVAIGQLQNQILSSEQMIAAKQQKMSYFERAYSPTRIAGETAFEALRRRGDAIAFHNQLANEITVIQNIIHPKKQQLDTLLIEQATNKRRGYELEVKLSTSHNRLKNLFSPIYVDTSEKILLLSELAQRSRDIPELGIWLTGFLHHNGQLEEALSALELTATAFKNPSAIPMPETYWDFVYMSLIVDTSNDSLLKLTNFSKRWPNHQQLEHLQAIAALRKKGGLDRSKSLFEKAMARNNSDQNYLLNSDAALVFVSGKKVTHKHITLAKKCIDRICQQKQTSYKALQASAWLAAREEDWTAAEKYLLLAKNCAPTHCLSGIEDQRVSYTNRRLYINLSY